MTATTVITELPLYTDLSYRYSASLEDTSKQLQFYWNSRSAQWHLDILNEDQTPVILGMPLVAQYPMLIDYSLENNDLTGYFLLLPTNSAQAVQLNTDSSVMAEFFHLNYIYTTGA